MEWALSVEALRRGMEEYYEFVSHMVFEEGRMGTSILKNGDFARGSDIRCQTPDAGIMLVFFLQACLRSKTTHGRVVSHQQPPSARLGTG